MTIVVCFLSSPSLHSYHFCFLLIGAHKFQRLAISVSLFCVSRVSSLVALPPLLPFPSFPFPRFPSISIPLFPCFFRHPRLSQFLSNCQQRSISSISPIFLLHVSSPPSIFSDLLILCVLLHLNTRRLPIYSRTDVSYIGVSYCAVMTDDVFTSRFGRPLDGPEVARLSISGNTCEGVGSSAFRA